jgi:exodeoxyribonuclease V beta subunit
MTHVMPVQKTRRLTGLCAADLCSRQVPSMRELDHLHIDLAGVNLIEASAGTGKTYAIACLYLRLLVEKELTPEQILVVTYTEAATKELRGRIRRRIQELLRVLDGACTDDPFLVGFCQRLDLFSRTAARDRLDQALKLFDTASIFTIHAFCLRALQDHAFESGSLYDTELLPEQTGVLQEIVEDFWRRTFFGTGAPLLGYALRKRYTPEKLLKFARELLANAKLKIIP